MDHYLGIPASGHKRTTSYRQKVLLTQTIKLGLSSKDDELAPNLVTQS